MNTTESKILKNEMNLNHYRVTIFGSARIKKDDPIYKQIFKLAKDIGKHNLDIVTGGGPGLMEAASAGHNAGRKDSNIHTVGLNITLPTEQKDNGHLDIKMQFNRFSERLDSFMALSNIVVVSPGGVGTLLEFFYTWQLIQVNFIKKIPIIMMGKMWKDLLRWIKKWPVEERLLNPEDLEYIHVAKNNKEAMRIIFDHYMGSRGK